MLYTYKAELFRVIDGDTVELLIDMGFNVRIRERFRMNRINAPEIELEERPAGIASKEWLHKKIAGRMLQVITHKDTKDKYGRYLCDIFVDDGTGRPVNDLMVEAGHAVYKQY